MPKDLEKRQQSIAIMPALPEEPAKPQGQWSPEDYDPELANLAMAREMVRKLGTPSRINKVFNIRKSIFKSLDHIPPLYREVRKEYFDEQGNWHPAVFEELDKGNPTGYDASLRVALYQEWERGSVNEDGVFFDRFWAFLMKPKYIISGMAGMQGPGQEEQGESGFRKIMNWFTGRGKKDAGTNNNSR